MERYLRFLLSHRALVLVTVAVLSILSAASLSRAVIASSIVKLFFGENPEYDEYRRLADQFGGNDLLFVAYEDPELLTAAGIARLERIVAAVKQLPDVKRADSLAGAQRIRAQGDDLLVEPWASLLARSSTYGAELARDDLIAGLFLGRDEKSTAVAIELVHDADRPVEALPEIQDDVLRCFLDAGLARGSIHLAGMIPETVEINDQTRFTLARIFPVMVLVVIAIVYLLFFRLWPVVLTISITLLSVLWTFGFATQLDRQINILMAMIPGLMMIVGFSDVIHMYNAYVAEVSAGGDRREVLIRSCAEVGTASAFTAVTELIGFMSLAFVPTPLMRLAGLVLGFGVASTLALVLTLVPVLLSLLPDSALLPSKSSARDPAGPILDRILRAAVRTARDRPTHVIGAFALLTSLALAGALRLRVDTDFAARLGANNHVRVAREFINQRFESTAMVDVYVTAKREDGLLDPAALSKIAAFQAELDGVERVDRAFSVIDLFRRLHEEMSGGEEDPFASGAMTRELAAQYLLLFEVSGGDGLDRLIDPSRKVMKISIRADDGGIRHLYEIGERAKEIARRVLPPELSVKPTGISYLLGDWLRFIIEGQRDGLLFSVLSTMLMMIVVLRSIRVGVASMFPNFLPLLFLGGWLGWTRDAVDSDTLVVASIAMGIAVDDTIHFMTRFRHELERDPDIERAMMRTYATTGRAMLQAAVVLCVGFSPFALADYYSLNMLGTLLPMTLFVALICEVLLMPALIVAGIARFGAHAPRR